MKKPLFITLAILAAVEFCLWGLEYLMAALLLCVVLWLGVVTLWGFEKI